MAAKATKIPIYRIEWIDSGTHVDYGWAKLEKYTDGISKVKNTVVTVGQFMYENDECLMVGLSYDPSHDQWYGGQMVFKENIVSIEIL